MLLYDGRGQPLALGSELGKGGEGSVYEIPSRPDLVAKVYLKPVLPEKAAKLALMAGLGTETLLRLAAWPVGTLHSGVGGQVTGLLMPRVAGFREIHHLYSPKGRLREFPTATWPFLLHAACNVARAFAAVHSHGHVVGDVNHGNIVVSIKATVMLIDCDSFQVSTPAQNFLCEVGIDTHTPPELQGQPFGGVQRSPNHDAFGLAVMFFQLLFMGRHPFAGVFLGQGDNPIHKSIQEFRFAYGEHALSRQMKAPPGTLPLSAVSPPIAALFERAFAPFGVRERARPSAAEWITALTSFAGQLTQCNHHPGHQYYKQLPACPWCEIEAKTAFILFNYPSRANQSNVNSFDVEQVWKQIVAIASPGPTPVYSALTLPTIAPSTFAIQQRQAKTTRQILSGSVIALAAVFLLLFPSWFCFILPSAVVMAGGVWSAGDSERKKQATGALNSIQAQWQIVERQWQTSATEEAFAAKRRHLEECCQHYKSIPGLRAEKLRELQANLEVRQREKYLDRQRLQAGLVSGIGAGRLATLQSFGIETALDVTEQAILRVPGFGPTRTAALLNWRRQVESMFRFKPSQGVDPADTARVQAEILKLQRDLERELSNGASELRQLAKQILHARQTLQPKMDEMLRARATAHDNLNAVK